MSYALIHESKYITIEYCNHAHAACCHKKYYNLLKSQINTTKALKFYLVSIPDTVLTIIDKNGIWVPEKEGFCSIYEFLCSC